MGKRLSYCLPLSHSPLGAVTHSRSVSASNYQHLLKTLYGICAEAVSMFALVCVCAYMRFLLAKASDMHSVQGLKPFRSFFFI